MRMSTSARVKMFEEKLYIAHLILFVFCKLAFTNFPVDRTGIGTGIKKEIILEPCLTVEEKRLKRITIYT